MDPPVDAPYIYIYDTCIYRSMYVYNIIHIYIYDIYTYKYIYLHMHMQFTIYYMCMYIVIEYQIFNSWGPLDILLHGVLNGKFFGVEPNRMVMLMWKMQGTT